MKRRTMGLLLAVFASLSVASTAVAAPKDKHDIGQREYMNKCAVCHGQSAKGDGGMIDVLKRAPTDLTTLSKRNGGVFPVDRISAIIDGQQMIVGHGELDMPVWGQIYRSEGVKAGEYYGDMPYNMEMYARTRILSLVDYLNRVQAK